MERMSDKANPRACGFGSCLFEVSICTVTCLVTERGFVYTASPSYKDIFLSPISFHVQLVFLLHEEPLFLP